jgi:hypothetical protein
MPRACVQTEAAISPASAKQTNHRWTPRLARSSAAIPAKLNNARSGTTGSR